MKICHLMLACVYIDDMGYQENILPIKHKELGFDVNIITSQFSFDSKKKPLLRGVGTYINNNNINVTVLPCKFKKIMHRNIRYYRGLFEKLVDLSPGIIFIHGGQFFNYLDLVKYKKKFPKCRIYMDQHGDYYNMPINKGFKNIIINKYIMRHCVRQFASICEKIWGVTPWRVDYLQHVYNIESSKIDLLVMGGDEKKINFDNQKLLKQSFRKEHSLPDDAFIIITGGKLNSEKKIIELIKEVNTINNSKVYLVVFGSIEDSIVNSFNELKSNKILYFDWLDQNSIYNMFLISDLAVFLGTHSVLWEQACACGLPAIFADWKGMHHVNIGGNCIFIKYKESFFHETLIRLIDNKKEYNEMKKISMDKGVSTFSYIKIAKRSIEYEKYSNCDK